jgi:4'-phosphopantetheinyl transferase
VVACVSAQDRERAQRLVRPRDRERFLTGRGWLRHLLAGLLGRPPGELQIVVGEAGKPRLAGPDRHLRFSASRSADLALYATSRDMEVGVDIEAVRAMTGVEALAARFFTSAERAALAELPAAQRLPAAVQCWTRKEAYGKAIGVGLGYPLDEVDVGVGDRHEVAPGWSVAQVPVPGGFTAAVAGAGLGDLTLGSIRQVCVTQK